MARIISTTADMQRYWRPTMSGVRNNSLSGTADYGNTSASWNTSDTDKILYNSGEDPSTGIIKWASWSRYAGWMNTRLGTTHGRYLTGKDFIKGVSFKWRTYPNQDGGIALRRWGIGIVSDSGTQKRWSSAEVNEWSTSSSWKTINYNFDGELANKLNSGWRFNELHFMLHTPSNGSTPSANCICEVKEFMFNYKSDSNAIIPAVRTYADRTKYRIA